MGSEELIQGKEEASECAQMSHLLPWAPGPEGGALLGLFKRQYWLISVALRRGKPTGVFIY